MIPHAGDNGYCGDTISCEDIIISAVVLTVKNRVAISDDADLS
jgi:hypothetical protein